jgi:predicted dehydrogenase
MTKLGVGIIGAGWVAGEHIRSFHNNPYTEVRAITGISKTEAQAKAAACGIKATAYDSYAEMLANESLDIVSVATPPNLHKEHALAIVAAGKHLLLEKPMATTLEDAREIRDAVAKAGVKSVVSFVLRWNPLVEIIRRQLAQEAIGRVFYGEVDYFHGVGPWYGQYSWNVKKEMGVSSLMSAGCHALDALRWFMGGEVAEVFQYAVKGDGPDFKEYEYAPTTTTVLKFTDGRIGKVASCIECIQPYVFNINLVGTEGTIKNNRVWSRKQFPGQTSWTDIPTILPDSGDVSHHPFTHEVASLVDAIRNNTECISNVADAFKTHEIIFAADRSGIEGKPVALPL